VNERLGSHIDLMPTIFDAVRVADDSRHDGQSLLAPTFEPRRMFFGADNGKWIGFIDGYDKVSIEVRGKRAELYDLATDPDELNNLAPSRAAEVKKLRAEAVSFARAVQARIDAAPVLSEKLSVEQVYDLFLDHVEVSLKNADGTVTSCGEGRGATCGSWGTLMREHSGTVSREQRHCVMVNVPPAGELLMKVTDRDTLALLSSTIAAMPDKGESDTRFSVVATTDGLRNKLVSVTRTATMARVEHPRPQREFLLTLQQRTPAKLGVDGGPPPEPTAREVCVQLSAWFTK
jgi:hypothetical protein